MSDSNLNFKNLFSNLLTEKPQYAEFRQKVFDQFQLPTKKNEQWKYTSLKPLDSFWKLSSARDVQKTRVEQNCIRIFSSNGFFNIAEISSVLKNFNIQVESVHLEKKISSAQKDFWHLSHAFLREGLLLKVKDTVKVERPIVIEHQIDGLNLFVHPYIAISLEKNSSLDVFEKFKYQQEDIWMNSATFGTLEEGATLNYYKTYDIGKNSLLIDNNYFEQKEASVLNFASLSNGARLLRNNTHVELLNKNATCNLQGLAILNKKNQTDFNVHVNHAAPETISRQVFKSVLNDESHFVFQGNVKIDSIAQKTDAMQINKNLLLGKKCRVDTKPRLDVFADDVKATHGSATGRMDQDEKFYLESRGLHPDLASSLMSHGFALETFRDLPVGFLKDELIREISC